MDSDVPLEKLRRIDFLRWPDTNSKHTSNKTSTIKRTPIKILDSRHPCCYRAFIELNSVGITMKKVFALIYLINLLLILVVGVIADSGSKGR